MHGPWLIFLPLTKTGISSFSDLIYNVATLKVVITDNRIIRYGGSRQMSMIREMPVSATEE